MAYPTRKTGSSTPTFEDLVNQDLKNKSYRPVYVLAGDDAYRMDGVVRKMRKDALGEGGAAFNFQVFQGDQTSVAQILQHAQNIPMFGGLQMIWVKQAEKCVADVGNQKLMEKYIQNPINETILVLCMDKADKRKKWVKGCIEKGYLFDFSPPTGEALVRWVQKSAKRHGLDIGHNEALILCELVGNDLMGLQSEIDKLSLLCEVRGKQIDAQEISQIIMDQAELEGFEITANLEPGKAGEVLKTWFRLSEWGKTAHEISPLMLSRIRKAAILSACREEGLSDAEIGKLTSSNPWSFKYFQSLLRSLGPAGVRKALETSLECDRKLKGSPLKPNFIIEKTIMDLCSKQNR